MSSQALSGAASLELPARQRRGQDSPRSTGRFRAAWPWLLGGVGIITLGVLYVELTGMRPAFDAYGWLDWGRQAAHLRLNTDAAPSWKPLTFLFTFPYALLTGGGALWLWMFTAVSGAFAAPVFAARAALRLAAPPATAGGEEPRRWRAWAAGLGALLAAAGIVGMETYWHLIGVTAADGLMTALALAALDCALCGRRRAAWALLVLLSLGRPEGTAVLALYSVYLWRAEPDLRPWLPAAILLVPLLWYGVPALTAHSAAIASDILAESRPPLPGNRLISLFHVLTSLYELPMQLAVAAALAYAIVRRERRWLLVILAALAYLAADLALVLHGLHVDRRYLFEPASLLIVLAGALVGRALGYHAPGPWVIVRWAVLAGAIVLVVALVPTARDRGRVVRTEVLAGRVWAKQIHRLHELIAREGGPKRILACGEPTTTLAFQTILAWELGVNVHDVSIDPSQVMRRGLPNVFFQPVVAGWKVIPGHARSGAHPRRCDALRAATPIAP